MKRLFKEIIKSVLIATIVTIPTSHIFSVPRKLFLALILVNSFGIWVGLKVWEVLEKTHKIREEKKKALKIQK